MYAFTLFGVMCSQVDLNSLWTPWVNNGVFVSEDTIDKLERLVFVLWTIIHIIAL
jgi:hypothetical protein